MKENYKMLEALYIRDFINYKSLLITLIIFYIISLLIYYIEIPNNMTKVF